MHYNRDFYIGDSEKSARELELEPVARRTTGAAWNRLIGQYIIDDLHEKLLPFGSAELLPMMNILVLISCGWLYTAAQLAQAQTVSESVEPVKAWLIDALAEADDL